MDYETGFIEHCLKRGVNPDELVKYAQENMRTVFIGDNQFSLPSHVRAGNARQFLAQNPQYDPKGLMQLNPQPPPARRAAPTRPAAKPNVVTNRRTGFRPSDSLPTPVKERPRPKFNPADSLPTPVKERPRPGFNPADSLPTPGNPFTAHKTDTLFNRTHKDYTDIGVPAYMRQTPTPPAPAAKTPAVEQTPQTNTVVRPAVKRTPARKAPRPAAPMIYGDAEIGGQRVTGAVNRYQEALKASPGYARANSPVRTFQPAPLRQSTYGGAPMAGTNANRVNPYDNWLGD